jgi:hypothetical protein
MPAKLPESFIQGSTPHYTIGTLPNGSEFAFPSTAMVVDDVGSCYLRPESETGGTEFIAVQRDERGYHVRILMEGSCGRPDRSRRRGNRS